MKRKKIIFAIFIAIAVLLLASSKSKAATSTATTKTANGGTIAWSFSYDTTTKQITDLACTNVSAISGEVEVPSTITVDGEEYTVVNLDRNAFYKATAVTKITLPSTVVSIEMNDFTTSTGCFEQCTALEEIDLGNVANLNYGCFKKCKSLKSIELPDGIKVIPENAFLGATSLISITFSDKLASIEASAFENCSSLQSFEMPDTVTTIGKRAFKECTNLKTLTISKNIQELPSYAFYGCTSLTEVVIPDSVISIQSDSFIEGAFANCEALQKVTIPDSVTFIGKYAFYNCGKGKLGLFVNQGSYAETWAKTNDVTYSYDDGSSQTPSGEEEKKDSEQQSGTEESNNNGSSSGASSSSQQSAQKSDPTQSSKIIPKTGESAIFISLISVSVIVGIIYINKFRKMKDIK